MEVTEEPASVNNLTWKTSMNKKTREYSTVRQRKFKTKEGDVYLLKMTSHLYFSRTFQK